MMMGGLMDLAVECLKKSVLIRTFADHVANTSYRDIRAGQAGV